MADFTPLRDILADLNAEAADLFEALVEGSPTVEHDAEELWRQRQYGAAARVPIDPSRPDLRALDALGPFNEPEPSLDPDDARQALDLARSLVEQARAVLHSHRAA